MSKRSFIVLGSIIVGSFVSACSGSTGNGDLVEGGGENSQGGLGGGAGSALGGGGGGGKKGNATTGATGQTSSGSTGACSDIAVSSGIPACDTCLKQSCCDPVKACAASDACVALDKCVSKCADETCTNGCIESNPDGLTLLRAVVSCAQQSCKGECS